MLRLVFVLTFLSTVFAAASCGEGGSTPSSSDATTSSSGGDVTADQACATYASAVCAKIASCFALELAYNDEATCKERFGLWYSSMLTAKGSTASPSSLEACGKAHENLSCDDFISNKLPAACDPSPGTLADGEPCRHHVQCESARCTYRLGSPCGACRQPIPAGGTCTHSTDCEDGLSCTETKCVPYRKAGATCDAAAPCEISSVCIGGKCAARAQAGEACDRGIQNCDYFKGLTCGEAMVCEKLKLAALGERCGSMGSDYVFCKGDGRCDFSAGPSGTCVAPKEDGSACNSAMGQGCKALSLCIGGVCALDDGSSCN